jgi:hypothetical protein
VSHSISFKEQASFDGGLFRLPVAGASSLSAFAFAVDPHLVIAVIPNAARSLSFPYPAKPRRRA